MVTILDENIFENTNFGICSLYWLGRWFVVQTSEEDELDYETAILEIRHLLDEEGHRHDDRA